MGQNGALSEHGATHPLPSEGVTWEVVGGSDKGGVIVRQGKELSSEKCSARLSTGLLPDSYQAVRKSKV